MKAGRTAVINPMRPGGARRGLFSTLYKYRAIYFLLLPGLIWYLMFAVAPLSGLQLAFKTYRAKLGIFGSPWNGTKNFDRMFSNPEFGNAIRQTLLINVLRLLVTFPFPVVMAVLFNEMRFDRSKNPLQVVFTLPHFLSYVVVASIFSNILSNDGLVNNVIVALGGSRVKIIGNNGAFLPLLYGTNIWHSAGWSMIVYLAAITDIDMEQYEAAEIDGASRWQMIIHVTIPCIANTIVIMFILAAGNIMTAGFDQVFNFSNPAVRKTAETLDMYIYRITFQAAPDFGFSMALTVFRSTINMLLLLITDRGAKLLGGTGLFSINN